MARDAGGECVRLRARNPGGVMAACVLGSARAACVVGLRVPRLGPLCGCVRGRSARVV